MRRHSDGILDHTIKGLAIDGTSTHGPIDVTDEVLAVAPEVLSGFLVKRIVRVRLKEQVLQADHHGIEVQHRLPVLPEDIQADISLQVYIWVVNLWDALDLRRFVGVAAVDSKGKLESGAFVHAFIWRDGQSEIEEIIWVRKVHCHS